MTQSARWKLRNPPHSLAFSIALKECFNGDGAVVSYLKQCLNKKGDSRETYARGISLCVRDLQHVRTCPLQFVTSRTVNIEVRLI
jgi:hypothetical protein